MQAIVKAARQERWPARIAAVISNRPDAAGLEFARQHGIVTAVVDQQDYAGTNRSGFDQALQQEIERYAPDMIVLAGFLRILGSQFVAFYAGRLLNIHPSLLPAFPGLATHSRALTAGVKIHGATVHFVTADLDHGPIIAQAAVPVLATDTEETLAARVLSQEHILYPNVLRWFIEEKIIITPKQILVMNEKQYNMNE